MLTNVQDTDGKLLYIGIDHDRKYNLPFLLGILFMFFFLIALHIIQFVLFNIFMTGTVSEFIFWE